MTTLLIFNLVVHKNEHSVYIVSFVTSFPVLFVVSQSVIVRSNNGQEMLLYG